MVTKAIIRRKMQDVDVELGNLHPLLARIYKARSVLNLSDIDRELAALEPFHTMKNINRAAERLASAIAEQQKILIVGDFDADGATSSALAVSVLRQFGAKHVDYIVPNRFTYGYGLTPEIVDVAKERNPDVIITVDNGISSIAGVRHANELGIDVVITDHHLPGDQLPEAYVIVNPNQSGDIFPSKSLAGVGVIFYVMLALRAYLQAINWFQLQNLELPNMAQHLDLVALGTVADVVSLDKNNRILVHQGINRIRCGFVRPGILALLKVSGREAKNLVAADLGYALGPRLNAAGRLDDMSLGIACLLTEDFTSAEQMAEHLDELNKERRAIESQMKQEAFEVVDKLKLSQQLSMGLCLYEEEWHQGVVGLVASRVKEYIHRPVIAFAKTEDGSLKGSARSITGLHIRDVLDAIATKNPGLITKFGGHAMAAGLQIEPENFSIFSEAFSNEIARLVSAHHLNNVIESDGELEDDEFNLQIAELLRENGPWGQSFPEPMFDGVFKLVSQRIVGQHHLKVVLKKSEKSGCLDGIAFNIDLDKWPNYFCSSVHIAYRLDVNEFNSIRKLQLLIEHLEPVDYNK